MHRDRAQEDGRGRQDEGNAPGWRERHATTIGTLASVVKRPPRSAVGAEEGRHVDGLAPGDPGVRPRVDTHDLTAAYQFLLAELSLISHFQDPLWLTAAPLAVEGMAAHLQPAFLEHLQAIVADWGMADPCQATRFLSSHINFDGGDDGHWEGSVRLLGEYLIDEPTLRWFLAALGVCTEALERCYTAGVDDMALW